MSLHVVGRQRLNTASRDLAATVSGRTYKRTRVRGFAEWRPRAASAELVDQVRAILEEYRSYLPVTAWQPPRDIPDREHAVPRR